jgi:hypothetical protein
LCIHKNTQERTYTHMHTYTYTHTHTHTQAHNTILMDICTQSHGKGHHTLTPSTSTHARTHMQLGEPPKALPARARRASVPRRLPAKARVKSLSPSPRARRLKLKSRSPVTCVRSDFSRGDQPSDSFRFPTRGGRCGNRKLSQPGHLLETLHDYLCLPICCLLLHVCIRLVQSLYMPVLRRYRL